MNGNFHQYSFSNKIYMFFCFVRTKLFYKNTKIIRFPFDIRNAKYIQLGDGLSVGRMCRLEAFPCDKGIKKKLLIIGKNSRLGDFTHISALCNVKIGDNCGIGPKCLITDLNHGNFSEDEYYDITVPYQDRVLSSKSVEIGNNVWLGECVCVLPGVTIGDGSVIGAFSNVTRSIPPYSMAVGNPAKVIKKYNFETHHWEKTNINL